ncbi:efflux RND transporter permease subunit [Lacunimicrobium album]
MLSRFFIDRPIFANVIAIVTMLVGIVCLVGLPIEQYPTITPPTIQVTANYPGANPQVLSDTVASPLEQAINGVEDMLYMSSNCSSNGAYTLQVTFNVGVDLNQAQVLVQNRIASALPSLPQEVQRLGVTANKQSTNIVIVVALTSPDNTYDDLFLSNYADIQVKDTLRRLPGVGEVQIFGAGSYGMRIWLDPQKLKARNLTTEDVIAVIGEQNIQVAAGQVGQRPTGDAPNFQYTVNTQGRLSDPEEFGEIIVKTEGTGSEQRRIVRLKDVARVELGARSYDTWTAIKGIPAAGIAIFQLPGSNSLEVAQSVKDAVEKMKPKIPEGIEASIPFNPTIFVEESIKEVYRTLFEAGILVLIVILLFLQDWRAVLIPATTVPVTIIGAFAALAAMDYSINVLTLFGLVLAIGIVVDDAIVIVENAVHHIDRGKLEPRTATIKAMSEVIGPIIGITLVLMAVFLPTIFMQGITGQLYRQFALTIAATALISAINAVSLKPAQCAVYLRPTPEKKNFFYRGFNYVYDSVEHFYFNMIKRVIKHPIIMLFFFTLIAGAGVYGYTTLPTSFIPTEDQGYAIMFAQLDDSASLERTHEVTKKIDEMLGSTPGVESWFMIGGMSMMDGGTSSNSATCFITFKPFEERAGHPEQSMEAIVGSVWARAGMIPEALIMAFPPPAIQGLGTTGGFEFRLQDRGNAGAWELQQVADEMVRDGNTQSGLAGLQTSFRAATPQLYVDIDRAKVKSLNIPLSSVFNTLQATLGSAYINDFNKFGRTWQVHIQADQQFRKNIDDIRRLEVRNEFGDMVPFTAFSTVKMSTGPRLITRYNLYPSVTINGEAKAGTSSGEAIALMEQMADRKLPNSMGYEWSGMSFQEKSVGGQSIYVFGMATLMVFLVLAAQYESWFLPAAVILIVPLALVGTVLAVMYRGMDNNVYTQIGIVLIIALASKNAILIVEFARELRNHGKSITEAAAEAARLRFRPILMTSFAFILGIVPLLIATGAGAVSRRSLGTAVFGGMVAATLFGVIFVPVFYVIMQSISERLKSRKKTVASHSDETDALHHNDPVDHTPAVAVPSGHH